MKSVKWKWITALSIAALLGQAHASQPTEQETRWSQTLIALVKVIADDGDPEQLNALAAPSAFVAPFEMNRTESITLLPKRLTTTNVVSARAYIHPSVTAATDLVGDLTSAGTIDAETIRKITPPAPEDLKKADATMAHWFTSALEARPGDPVAVLVLYDDGKGEKPHAPTLTFALVRGDFDAAGNARISRIVYGTMESAVK